MGTPSLDGPRQNRNAIPKTAIAARRTLELLIFICLRFGENQQFFDE